MIHFFLKAGKKTGLGHIFRCCRLIKQLNRPAKFWLFQNRYAQKVIDKTGVSVDLCKGYPDIERGDVLVIDRNNNTADFILRYRSQGAEIITFDDLGSGERYARVSIDANRRIGNESERIVGSEQPERYWGLKYIVLDPEFSEEPVWKNRADQLSLLICMGGADTGDYTSELLTSSLLRKTFNVIDVIHSSESQVKKKVFNGKAPSNIRFHGLQQGLHNAMKKADIIICSGGITMLEAHAAGLPSVVISVARHQNILASEAEERGAALHAGSNVNQAVKSAVLLAEKTALRKQMALKGRAAVDGKGIFRVTSIIESLA